MASLIVSTLKVSLLNLEASLAQHCCALDMALGDAEV